MSIQVKYFWTAAMATLLVAGPVQAETWEQKVDRHFSLLDADGDGMISKAEAGAHPPLARHFRAMDKNKNGGLSKYELANYRVAPRNRALANAETSAGSVKTTGRTE